LSAIFRAPPRILHGRGCFAELGRVAAELSDKAAVVSGGGSLARAGVIDRALGLLAEAKVETVTIDGVKPDPDLATVDLIRERLFESGATVVVSIGGGSVIDAAKAAAGLAAEDGPAVEFQQGGRGGRSPETKGMPHVAVPTTAGTGAEATPNAVITNPDVPEKKSIRGPGFMPAAAIVDPELLVTLPARPTAESGMDALVQAVESATSIHATELTRALSRAAAALVAEGLPAAVADGADLDAREKCSMGSLMAGMALANARLGVVHGLAHPLGARYGLSHGLVCGVLLPAALRLNAAAAADEYGVLERACGVRGSGGDTAGERLAAWVEWLLGETGLPTGLSRAKIPAGDFAALASESMGSGSLKANPLEITEDHLVAILEEVCGGGGGRGG